MSQISENYITADDFCLTNFSNILSPEQKQEIQKYFSEMTTTSTIPATMVALHPNDSVLSREAWDLLHMKKYGTPLPVIDQDQLQYLNEGDLEADAMHGIHHDVDFSTFSSMDKNRDPDLIAMLTELGPRAFCEGCKHPVLVKVPTSMIDYLKIGKLHPDSMSDSVKIDWKAIVHKTCDECEPGEIAERLAFLRKEADITELYIHGVIRFYNWHKSWLRT